MNARHSQAINQDSQAINPYRPAVGPPENTVDLETDSELNPVGETEFLSDSDRERFGMSLRCLAIASLGGVVFSLFLWWVNQVAWHLAISQFLIGFVLFSVVRFKWTRERSVLAGRIAGLLLLIGVVGLCAILVGILGGNPIVGLRRLFFASMVACVLSGTSLAVIAIRNELPRLIGKGLNDLFLLPILFFAFTAAGVSLRSMGVSNFGPYFQSRFLILSFLLGCLLLSIALVLALKKLDARWKEDIKTSASF